MVAFDLKILLLFPCLFICGGGLVHSLICFSLFIFSKSPLWGGGGGGGGRGLFCHVLSAGSQATSIFDVGRCNGNLALENPE